MLKHIARSSKWIARNQQQQQQPRQQDWYMLVQPERDAAMILPVVVVRFLNTDNDDLRRNNTTTNNTFSPNDEQQKQQWQGVESSPASAKATTTPPPPTTTTTTTTTAVSKLPPEAHFKNPMVATLWAARQEAKDRLAAASSAANTPIPVESIPGKTPEESQTELIYAFSSDPMLREAYQNPWGEMRVGKILEDLDALAGNIAFHHVYGAPLIVTASVDRIRLRQRPAIDQDVHLCGKVTWVGKSSMEIRMQCANLESKDEWWLEAYFTFVTLDPQTNKPVSMPALIPTTPEEKEAFALGARKAQAKKQARLDKRKFIIDSNSMSRTENSLRLEELATSLLDQAGPLLRMPSLADPHSILMQHTRMQNAMMAQPQMKNLHNRIFGGFLMRRAFELAFANAYVFGGRRPIFLEVDDISFESPVDVGDLLVFNSRVLYTLPQRGGGGEAGELHLGRHYFHNEYENSQLSLVMIQVEAWVTEPEKTAAKVSNYFYFTFGLPPGSTCRTVLPSNLEEARLMASRIIADEEQARFQ